MNDLLKEFKIELIKQDLNITQVATTLGISKPTLIKRIQKPELFTIENIKNLEKLKLNLIKQ